MSRFFGVITLACILLAACSSNPPKTVLPTPAVEPTPNGSGTITGTIDSAFNFWPGETDLFIFAAPFYGKGDEGFYTLDPEKHPKARLQAGGEFRLENVPAGRYVLVVGPAAEQALLVVDEAGKARVIEVKSGEANNLGALRMNP